VTKRQYLSTLQVLSKRAHLCTSDYDEPYFDFHCLPGGKKPADGLSWYTICGTPVANRAEYVAVVGAFAAFGFFVYLQLLAFSGTQPRGRPLAVDGKGKAQKKTN
jgi:hypothetical protein